MFLSFKETKPTASLWYSVYFITNRKLLDTRKGTLLPWLHRTRVRGIQMAKGGSCTVQWGFGLQFQPRHLIVQPWASYYPCLSLFPPLHNHLLVGVGFRLHLCDSDSLKEPELKNQGRPWASHLTSVCLSNVEMVTVTCLFFGFMRSK